MDVATVNVGTNYHLITGQMPLRERLRDFQRQLRRSLARLEGLDHVVILDAAGLVVLRLGFQHSGRGVFRGTALCPCECFILSLVAVEDVLDADLQMRFSRHDFCNSHQRSATCSISW